MDILETTINTNLQERYAELLLLIEQKQEAKQNASLRGNWQLFSLIFDDVRAIEKEMKEIESKIEIVF